MAEHEMHQWTDQFGYTWECDAYDHGPFCRLCRVVAHKDPRPGGRAIAPDLIPEKLSPRNAKWLADQQAKARQHARDSAARRAKR